MKYRFLMFIMILLMAFTVQAEGEATIKNINDISYLNKSESSNNISFFDVHVLLMNVMLV